MVKKSGGRLKGSRNESTIMKEIAAYRPMLLGKPGKLTLLDLLADKLRRRALAGDLNAIDYRDALRACDGDSGEGGVFLVPERVDEEEWFRRCDIMREAQEILDARPMVHLNFGKS